MRTVFKGKTTDPEETRWHYNNNNNNNNIAFCPKQGGIIN
jgi:hypothetical protein